MDNPLPSNDEIEAFSQAVNWQDVEDQKKRFNAKVIELAADDKHDELSLDQLSEAVGLPLSTYNSNSEKGNVILAETNGRQYILGSFVSKRFRENETFMQSMVPYNFNPSVNHNNIDETYNPSTKMRAMGAELELGVYYEDGTFPDEATMQKFIHTYRENAHRLGITPQVDREACRYQVEVHVAPGVGYHRMRQSLDSIMTSLVIAGETTKLNTAIMAANPVKSDFELTDDPKVRTATAVMKEANSQFPDYVERQIQARKRYHIDPESNVVQLFRLQGCHIHLDIAGRSEALGLFTFYTMLRSASAIANAAVLKGSPFVNGTCDPEYICTREFLRKTTITGRYIDLPITPHLSEDGLAKYYELIEAERANRAIRGLLYEDGLGQPVSVMHNPIGRVRPDLGMKRRICTIESTGMPVNASASRQAAVLTDFEFTHALIESYYRKYGTDLNPMVEDKELWQLVGPLSTEKYAELQDLSDREGTDIEVETAAGNKMSLADFYEMKRLYMHRNLIDIPGITPRDIDDVYTSLGRMLNPPSGRVAQTIEQYICEATYRSTGNWGKILRNAFIEEGGTIGSHNPDAVLKVSNRVHNALRQRYLNPA